MKENHILYTYLVTSTFTLYSEL